MESDTLKQQIRDTYTKEYERKLPLSLKEKLMAYPAALLVGSSSWAVAGGAIGLAAGFAAAPLWIFGGCCAFMAGAMLAVGTVLAGKKTARDAVEADIDNGSLVKRYQDEVLSKTPSPAPAVAPASTLNEATAKAAFNTPASPEQTQAQAPVTPKAPAPQAPVQP